MARRRQTTLMVEPVAELPARLQGPLIVEDWLTAAQLVDRLDGWRREQIVAELRSRQADGCIVSGRQHIASVAAWTASRLRRAECGRWRSQHPSAPVTAGGLPRFLDERTFVETAVEMLIGPSAK